MFFKRLQVQARKTNADKKTLKFQTKIFPQINITFVILLASACTWKNLKNYFMHRITY